MCFPIGRRDWPRDSALAPAVRAAYRQTPERFLRYCSEQAQRPTVSLARQFVELARLEHSPGPTRLDQWKEALNWYFREGRKTSRRIIRGVPPAARTDMGMTAWEQALIAGVRQRHFSWRTEQTYRA